MFYWLVVEPYPSEKYEFVTWDDENPNMWKNNGHIPVTTTNQIFLVDRKRIKIEHGFPIESQQDDIYIYILYFSEF